MRIRHARINTPKYYQFTPGCDVVAAECATAPIDFRILYIHCYDVDDILFKKQVNEIFFGKLININLIKITCGHLLTGTLLSVYSPNHKCM